MYQQGDIVKVPFLYTDHTGSKPRPAIIISNEIVNRTDDVIMAQITSVQHNDAFTFHLNTEDLEKPLMNKCQVRCHKIFIVNKKLIIKPLSHLKSEKQTELFQKICSVLLPTVPSATPAQS
jgi:mRNA-degrading endonuclease toxin of MazEF toxin-antitoxin module